MTQVATIVTTDSVLKRADTLSEQELDQLPVGMVQLDHQGKVLKYNRTESEIAQMSQQEQIGKSFFDEVAPCTKVKEFYGQFVEGVKNKDLHVRFPYEFKFRDGRRKDVLISMFYSEQTQSVWVLVDRP